MPEPLIWGRRVLSCSARSNASRRTPMNRLDVGKGPAMTIEGNKDQIRGLFDEVWTNGDVSAAARFYAPGSTLDDLQEFARALYAAFPDWQATIDELIAEGDRVVVRWTG